MAALRDPRRESALAVESRAVGRGQHPVAKSSARVHSPAPGMRGDEGAPRMVVVATVFLRLGPMDKERDERLLLRHGR